MIRRGVALLSVVLISAAAPTAFAQTLASPDLAPTFSDTPSLPGGMIALGGSGPPSFAPGAGVHGYLSTGVSTDSGRGVEGAAIVPVLPGVTLEAGGGTGRAGVFVPWARKAVGTATVSNYHAALHIRPTDTVQIDIAVAESRLQGPGVGVVAPLPGR